MSAEPPIVGGTYDWFLNKASINTEAAPSIFGAWDISSAAITISFLYYGNGTDANPTASYHFTATTLTVKGTANYINQTSLFNVAGWWGVSWKISLSGTVQETSIYKFQVFPSGAAA